MSDELTDRVKALALEMGFSRVGIAPAGEVPHAQGLLDWLGASRHGPMGYMAKNLSLRLDPSRLVPGARSVVCLAVSYDDVLARIQAASRSMGVPPMSLTGVSPVSLSLAPGQDKEAAHGQDARGTHGQDAHATPDAGGVPATQGLIARYARGRDYHKILKRACIKLMDVIRSWQVGFEGRAFVDSGPVMERSLAALAGLGWIGRNGCLIVPGIGSYVLLCEIICNLPLRTDGPLDSSCGRCGQCVKSCPTGALMEDGTVDANRCVSCLTIEHRGEIAPEHWPQMGTRIFGCDACQEVCPHNVGCVNRPRFAHEAPKGEPVPAVGMLAEERHTLPLAEVLRWEQGDWDAATRGLALRRVPWPMFLRNAAIAAGNSGDNALVAPLKELRLRAEGDLGFLRPVIDWAMSRLAEEKKHGANA
jgi:epoxyqueuosine reductase